MMYYAHFKYENEFLVVWNPSLVTDTVSVDDTQKLQNCMLKEAG